MAIFQQEICSVTPHRLGAALAKMNLTAPTQKIAQGLIVFWQPQRQYHTAAQKRCREFTLFVGGNHHQRRRALLSLAYGPPQIRHGKIAITQGFQQTIGEICIGFINLVDQQHTALPWLRPSGRCGTGAGLLAHACHWVSASSQLKAHHNGPGLRKRWAAGE